MTEQSNIVSVLNIMILIYIPMLMLTVFLQTVFVIWEYKEGRI
jgi:hypothetical protein